MNSATTTKEEFDKWTQGLSQRAKNNLLRVKSRHMDKIPDRDEIIRALGNGTCHPRYTRNFGKKTYAEICAHLKLPMISSFTGGYSHRVCPHCGKLVGVDKYRCITQIDVNVPKPAIDD